MSNFTHLKNSKLKNKNTDTNPKNTTITIIYYNENFYKKDIFTSKNDLDIDFNFDGNVWINLDNTNDTSLIKELGYIFNLDNLSLEYITNPRQRVKIENRENYIHLIMKMLAFEKNTKEISYEQVSFIVKEKVLITFQETEFDIFDSVRERIESCKIGSDITSIYYLTYLLVERIVDNYLLILDEVENDINKLETQIIVNPQKNILSNIISLKKNAITLKKFISPIRDLISKLRTRNTAPLISENMNIYLNDLNEHCVMIFDTVNSLNSRTTDLVQLYHSTVSNTMNEIMKILAIISTVFMPLTFISGLYGMNFVYMPELKWKFGYLFALSLMVILVACMVVYFKRKKWF